MRDGILNNEPERLCRELLKIWENGETDSLRDILSPDMVYYVGSENTEFKGIVNVGKWVGHVHAFASEVAIEIGHVQTGPQSSSIEWVLTGVQSHPIPDKLSVVTDRPFTLRGVTIVETQGGKIIRAADYYDVLGFTLQLGAHVELPGGTVLE